MCYTKKKRKRTMATLESSASMLWVGLVKSKVFLGSLYGGARERKREKKRFTDRPMKVGDSEDDFQVD